MKVAVFYHVALMGEWRAVDGIIMDALEASGVLDAASVFVRNECAPETFEFPTLDMVRGFAQGSGDYAVLYLHTKGVHRSSESIIDWRECMLYWMVERWRECVAQIEAGYDAVGINHVPTPERHFQGNFWWASTRYLASLGPVADITFRPNYEDQTERHKAEFWLLSRDGRGYQPYHHHLDPYKTRNPRERYEALPF